MWVLLFLSLLVYHELLSSECLIESTLHVCFQPKPDEDLLVNIFDFLC